MTIRVLLADDHALVRAGFRLIIDDEDDLTVVAEARTGAEAMNRARTCRPDVVLMDIRMPTLDGIDATRRLTAQNDAPRVVILTTYDLDEYLFDARTTALGRLMPIDISNPEVWDTTPSRVTVRAATVRACARPPVPAHSHRPRPDSRSPPCRNRGRS